MLLHDPVDATLAISECWLLRGTIPQGLQQGQRSTLSYFDHNDPFQVNFSVTLFTSYFKRISIFFFPVIENEC